MIDKTPNAESVLTPLEIDEAIKEKAALVVKKHAKDEDDLSVLLDMLGLAA